MNSPATQLRIETTLAELRAITTAIRLEYGNDVTVPLNPIINNAVRIYCAKLMQEAQK